MAKSEQKKEVRGNVPPGKGPVRPSQGNKKK